MKMKKTLMTLILVMLVTAMLLVGCGRQSATTATTATTPTTTTTTECNVPTCDCHVQHIGAKTHLINEAAEQIAQNRLSVLYICEDYAIAERCVEDSNTKGVWYWEIQRIEDGEVKASVKVPDDWKYLGFQEDMGAIYMDVDAETMYVVSAENAHLSNGISGVKAIATTVYDTLGTVHEPSLLVGLTNGKTMLVGHDYKEELCKTQWWIPKE